MGIESDSVTTISGLNSSWPLGGDFTVEGDNHIRLIKRVLKSMFPGASGSGFATPIIATEAELNYLDGLTGNVQAQIDGLGSGGESVLKRLCGPNGLGLTTFNKSSYAVPVGWKRITVSETYMMVVTTTQYQGETQGNSDPTNFTHSHSQGTFKITAANLPKHSHEMQDAAFVQRQQGGAAAQFWPFEVTTGTSDYTGDSGPGWGSNTAIQLPNTNANSWTPRVAGMQLIERDITLG